MTGLTGRRPGDVEIVREPVRGGTAVVYEARQVSRNRREAVHVLAAGPTPRAVARFCPEAEASARLCHTDIVPG